MKKSTIFILILDILVGICFFVFYGPFSGFRNLLISTAMKTKTHQYIAYTFYSEETVRSITYKGSYIPLSDTMRTDEIVIDPSPKDTYDNEYDKEILTREPGNDDYKYIPVKVGDYDGHLVAIYDPSKVTLITSKTFNTGTSAEQIYTMCQRLGGRVCINGGMFQDPTGWGSDIPQGYLIKDGKIIWSDSTGEAELIGMTYDNKLLLTRATGEEAIAQGMRDALQFGPFLIVNGEKLQFRDSAGGYDRAARVAIGQRKDGIILFLVTEGTHMNGPKLSDVVDVLSKYGAHNAANLDGGSSTQLVIDGVVKNVPKNVYGEVVEYYGIKGRPVVSGFGMIP